MYMEIKVMFLRPFIIIKITNFKYIEIIFKFICRFPTQHFNNMLVNNICMYFINVKLASFLKLTFFKKH